MDRGQPRSFAWVIAVAITLGIPGSAALPRDAAGAAAPEGVILAGPENPLEVRVASVQAVDRVAVVAGEVAAAGAGIEALRLQLEPPLGRASDLALGAAALGARDRVPFRAEVPLPGAPGEHLLALRASGVLAGEPVGAYRQVYAVVAPDGATAFHVDHLPVGDVEGVLGVQALEGSSSGPVTVQSHSTFVVRFCLQYPTETGAWVAQRLASVTVVNANTNGYLWDGSTGNDGCATSAALPRVGNSAVKVEWELFGGGAWIRNALGVPYIWLTSSKTVGSLDTVDFGTWRPPTNTFAGRIFEYVIDAADFNWNQLGFSVGTARVNVPSALCSIPCYNINSNILHVPVDGVQERSPDDVMSSYGSFVMDRAYNDAFWPGLGTFGFCSAEGGHAGLAWAGGFSFWYGTRAGNWLSGSDVSYSRPFDGSSFSVNMESTGACAGSNGDTMPLRIAASLWDLFDGPNDGYDTGSAPLTQLRDTLLACDSADFRAFYDSAACSWAQKGFNTDPFVRAAYQNTIDYDLPPSAVEVTSQAAFAWVRGTVGIDAVGTDPDTSLAAAEFRVSSDGACDGTDAFVATDTSVPFGASYATTGLGDGTGFWTCAKVTDGIKEGPWDASASHVTVDNTRPTGSAFGPFVGIGQYEVEWSASDATSGLATAKVWWLDALFLTATVLCEPDVAGLLSASGTCSHPPLLGTHCYWIDLADRAGNTRSTFPECTVAI